MKWFRRTDLREGKSMEGVNERAGGESCNHMSFDGHMAHSGMGNGGGSE